MRFALSAVIRTALRPTVPLFPLFFEKAKQYCSFLLSQLNLKNMILKNLKEK